jgi:hypothetical protein
MGKPVAVPQMGLVEAIQSPLVFGKFFKDLSTWREWILLSKLLDQRRDFSDDDMALYRTRTGWSELPAEPLKEIFIGGGRRIGKSTFTAIWSAYYAIFGDYKKYLAPGENARIWILATNLAQAQIIQEKLSAIFALTPFLRSLVRKEKSGMIILRNGVILETKPSSWRTTRGFSCAVLTMEELQSWRYEADASANVDSEVYGAIKPGMLTIKNSITFGIGTLFARAGLLYSKYSSAHGHPGTTMFWGPVPSWEGNLSITEAEFEAELRENLGDCAYFAEAGIAWREDIETFLPLEIVIRATVPCRAVVPFDARQTYVAFCDASELVSKSGDSMCMAIAHKQGGMVVLDYLDEVRPPADPKMVIERFTAALHEYHIAEMTQDRVSLGWIQSDFLPKGITIKVCELPKSKLYDHFSVLMNKNSVELLDDDRLKKQISNLERRQVSGGESKVDHIPGAKDDRINVVAGAVVLCGLGLGGPEIYVGGAGLDVMPGSGGGGDSDGGYARWANSAGVPPSQWRKN